MKGISTGSSLKKLIIAIVILGALIGIGFATGVFSDVEGIFENFNINGNALLRVFVMALIVLIIENLLIFILSLIKSEKGRIRTVVSVLGNLLRYVALVVIICWGLSILGADVGTIVAGVGIFALIIGFGANSLIADMVTGIFMIFENQYNVGDFIEVDGFRGKVTSIGIRTTCIEDAGGNIKIIINSAMTNILNRSNHNSRAVSVIGIPYETDLEALEANFPEMMKGIYERNKETMLAEPVYLGVEELADSAVVLKFVVEVEDRNIFSAGRTLNRELFLGFRKAGVEVPFPQIDVHQK